MKHAPDFCRVAHEAAVQLHRVYVGASTVGLCAFSIPARIPVCLPLVLVDSAANSATAAAALPTVAFDVAHHEIFNLSTGLKVLRRKLSANFKLTMNKDLTR